MIKVEKIVNKPVASNCFIITNDISNSCVIVDPGTEDCADLFNALKSKDLIPEYVVLTHEHIDHIIGIKELRSRYKVKLVCSSACNENINSFKYNLSGYSDRFHERTDLPTADILVEDINYTLRWDDYLIQFHKADGHSQGSICFNIGNDLFVGDTLIKGFKTTTVLPGASKEELLNTFEKIFKRFESTSTRIFSGHYEDFYLNEIEEETKKQIEDIKKKIRNKAQVKLNPA